MLLEAADPRLAALDEIDVNRSRVFFGAAPIVLLCGGPTPQKTRAEDPDPPIASLRHAITRAHTAYQVFCPEEITHWQADGVFQNLMDFEEDLASVCSLVVVILESAGSLVELGAFSQLPDFKNKLVAICSNEFHERDSFINLGVLRHIRKAGDTRVKVYPWNVRIPTGIGPELLADVIEDIKSEIDTLVKSQSLRLDSRTHVAVLICELLSIFSALKESEIFDYLTQKLGVDLGKAELKSRLFLLIEFGLIARESYSDSIFYVRTPRQFHHIRFASVGASKFDDLRVKTACLEFYRASDLHKHRRRVIPSIARQEGVQ